MVVSCIDIIECMNEIAPICLAESWDNVGLLVGDKNSTVKKILVALDALNPVIDEAIAIGADLIITHHPIFLKGLSKINSDTLEGKIYKLIKNNISVYSAHTNFDCAEGGTNDILAKLLSLQNIEILEQTYTINVGSQTKIYGIGRIGLLDKQITLLEFSKFVKQKLGLDNLNIVGDLSKPIKKVALCTGSGSEYLNTAIAKKADVYISGDIKYHIANDAKEIGIALIDGTHYATENIAMPVLKDYLQQKAQLQNWEIEFFNSKLNIQPFQNI